MPPRNLISERIIAQNKVFVGRSEMEAIVMDLRSIGADIDSLLGGGGGTTGWSGMALNYSALPAAASHTGEVYLVLDSQGTSWLPGWLGGTYYPKGLYYSDGATWEYMGEIPYQFSDTDFEIYDNLDNSKRAEFQVSGISTGTTRTYSWPDKNGTVAMLSDITGSSVTIVNINSDPYNAAQTSGEHMFLVDATAGDITINLPTAVGNTAKITIKKTDSSTNIVITDASGAQTIDGDLTKEIYFQNTTMTIISDGSNWKRIN